MENQCATHISGFTFGRSLNFDRARWAGRWSTGLLRISLYGANAMYFWPVWVSPSYCKLQRNLYCGRRIFPAFLMLGVDTLPIPAFSVAHSPLPPCNQCGPSHKPIHPPYHLCHPHKALQPFLSLSLAKSFSPGPGTRNPAWHPRV